MNHAKGCPRLQFWDAGQLDAPCLCDDAARPLRLPPSLKAVKATASALFSAQNTLTGYWQSLNTGTADDLAAQVEVECTQDMIRKAIEALGGVDYLCSLGA